MKRIALIAALALAGCNSTSPVTVQVVANDIGSIANGIAGALASPAVIALIPPATLPKVQEAVADLQKVAADVAANPSSAATKGNVAIVEADVNTIVGSLAGLPLPPPAPTILEAAVVLLPVVEAAVGLVVPAAAAPGHMSVETARAVLAHH